MAPQLYKVNGAETAIVVADDVNIVAGNGHSWIASELLGEEDIQDLIAGEISLYDYEIDEDLAGDYTQFVLVPREEWASLINE